MLFPLVRVLPVWLLMSSPDDIVAVFAFKKDAKQHVRNGLFIQKDYLVT